MKLARIYSNDEATFPTITFHDGLNVVFARVQNPTRRDQDSHNLGKTFLIEIIDFTLLKEIDGKHPLRRFPDRFGEFVFYLEVVTTRGQYVTVRRRVQGKPVCSIHVADAPHSPLTAAVDDVWTYPALSRTKAVEILNRLLGLAAPSGYDYRKGLGYVLRRQSDWDDVFRLERFRRGRDRDWKPYVAGLLGFDAGAVAAKYDLEDTLAALEQRLHFVEQEAGTRSSEYGKLQGLIALKQAAIERARRELNQFSFRELEAEVNTRGVRVIEDEISQLNERRYTIDYELQEIERSLATNLPFDIDRIRRLFQEASVVLPDALVRSYEDLVAFNRRLSAGRAEHLTQLRVSLSDERSTVEERLFTLDEERRAALSALQERETFQKYVALQGQANIQERELDELRRRLERLDAASTTQQEIASTRAAIDKAAQALRDAVYQGNPTLTAMRQTLADYVERVLSVPALLSVSVNDHGNLEFDVRTLDKAISERETSEAAGTSYRKVLCACFDLALLSVNADRPFYRFVYQDGVLEGLDNRKKVNLLELARSLCTEHQFRYIVSVIDADVPRDERDHKLLFSEEEIVRELHDQGDLGRLFRMPAF